MILTEDNKAILKFDIIEIKRDQISLFWKSNQHKQCRYQQNSYIQQVFSWQKWF